MEAERRGIGDMFAEFIFTPAESKLLIATAVSEMELVKNAMKNGIVAMHPSSSTHFLSRILNGGKDHSGKVWVTGTVVPKGLCVDARTGAGTGQLTKSLADPGKYPHTVVFYKGELQSGWTIYDLCEKMGPGDLYIKGVNAVDAAHTTGVLLGSMVDGTIGKMVETRKQKGFSILVPVGLEKLIPGTIEEAASFISCPKDYSMGVKCRLFPLKADVTVTEVEALELISGGGSARVFSCGGLNGAEGAVSIALQGTEEQVSRAITVCEQIKGNAELPSVVSPACMTCKMPTCYQGGKRKPWVQDASDEQTEL